MIESEELYRALFNTSIDAILLLKDNKLVDVNPSALKIFDCNRDKMIGKTLWALSPRKQPDGSLSKDAALQKINLALSGEPQLFDWQHRRCDGSNLDAFVGYSALMLNKENLVQIVLRLETTRQFQNTGGDTQ